MNQRPMLTKPLVPCCAGATMKVLLLTAIVSCIGFGSGCAAISNPVADGIPVRRLPPEVLGERKDLAKAVPLEHLKAPPTGPYRLAPGDILGVFIEGVLGGRGEQPPVRIPEQGDQPPGIGYPIPVRENGTVPLPIIDPITVNGLTIEEAQAKIALAYRQPKQLLKDDSARIIVTLLKARQYHVLVLREDAGGTTFGSTGGFGAGLTGGGGTSVSIARKAAGYPLDLPANENDLLNALTRSGGLPGSEADDVIIIQRDSYRPGVGVVPDHASKQTIRVPLRTRPGQQIDVKPEDLVLRSGDVILVKARPSELFFTGGLLPPRAFPLPQDRDLDILEAIALVGGPLYNGGVNANNLSGQIQTSGLGFPSPSQITVLRKTPNGGQIPIIVNLNRAAQDPRERITLKANDYVILQSTKDEAVSQYFTSTFRNLFGWNFLSTPDFFGSLSFTIP